MLRIVIVEFGEWLLLLPSHDVSPFDAVFGLAGDSGECAERNCSSWCVHVELAFDAGCHGWEDYSRLALEA